MFYFYVIVIALVFCFVLFSNGQKNKSNLTFILKIWHIVISALNYYDKSMHSYILYLNST